jgi:hypothetical protein
MFGSGRPALPALRSATVDTAHPCRARLGGCAHPDCVVSLDQRCHRASDRGELYLLPDVEPGFRAELAHALSNPSLLALLLRRVTGMRWAPTGERPTGSPTT